MSKETINEEVTNEQQTTEKTQEELEKEKRDSYITFSDKMILAVKEHSDKTKIDPNTNEVVKLATLRLPSKEFRSYRFGIDSNGIDRDKREATINLVNSYIKHNLKSDGSLLNHFSYLKPDRKYTIHFKGWITGQVEGKNVFDQPERATMTGMEIADMFREARMISREKAKEKEAAKQAAEEKKAAKKTKSIADKKGEAKKKATKPKQASKTTRNSKTSTKKKTEPTR